MNTTLVLGASTNPYRYAYTAIQRLLNAGEKVFALGKNAGEVLGIPIETDREVFEDIDIDTITLYLNPFKQEEYYDWVINKKPRRVIFNPGSENSSFAEKLRAVGIEVEIACTLVMLSIGNYRERV